MRNINPLALGFAVLCLTLPALAQQPIVYPAKGQSAARQNADEAECHGWARQSTGIDPAAVAQTPLPAAPPPPPPAPAVGGGQRFAGAARGAVGGAIIGEIVHDDAGKGAAVGAVAGTMVGGAKARQQQQAQQQQAQAQAQQQQAQAQAQQQQQLDTFNRAMGACMEGRGYIIK